MTTEANLELTNKVLENISSLKLYQLRHISRKKNKKKIQGVVTINACNVY
jgi:hypothetical protein